MMKFASYARVALLSAVAALSRDAERVRRVLTARARQRTTDDLLREVAEAVTDPMRGPALARRRPAAARANRLED